MRINEIGELNLEKTLEKHKTSHTLEVASDRISCSVLSTFSEYGSLNIQKEDLNNVERQNLQREFRMGESFPIEVIPSQTKDTFK